MSTAIAKNFQVGTSGTATDNFTIRQPATPDGTVRIANGNSGTTTDLVTVTSAGNVGIGTSSPAGKLHVLSASGVQRIISEVTGTTGSDSAQIRTVNGAVVTQIESYSTTGLGYVGTVSAHPFAFLSSGVERARITANGNLLVGTTTERAALTIGKDGIQLYVGPANFGAGVEGGEIQFGRGTDGASAWAFDVLTGASPDIRLINGSAVGVQLVNGATAWSAYSDTRLKKNIAPLRSVLNDLQHIECINYRLLNADTEDTPIRVGVSAQSLVGKFDEVVDTVQMKGDTTDYLAVRYSDMVPYLVKAIQELKAEFDAYKATHP
jgi:hypothetical protein